MTTIRGLRFIYVGGNVLTTIGGLRLCMWFVIFYDPTENSSFKCESVACCLMYDFRISTGTAVSDSIPSCPSSSLPPSMFPSLSPSMPPPLSPPMSLLMSLWSEGKKSNLNDLMEYNCGMSKTTHELFQ